MPAVCQKCILGHPNRIERYNQYENMDSDSEINACLDILAEFCTQATATDDLPFQVKYNDKPTDHEIDIIKKQLQQWVKLNKLDQRIFRIFRNTLKYGDQVFVRDPESFEMYWVDMTKVARVIVNESEGKRPEQYVIRDINPNFQNLSLLLKPLQIINLLHRRVLMWHLTTTLRPMLVLVVKAVQVVDSLLP
jgi:hypothetical protein